MRLRLFFIFLISMGFAFGANAQKTISRSATSTLPAGDLKKVENKPVQTAPQDTSTTQTASNDSIAAYYDFKTTNFMRERDLFFFGDSGQVLDTTLYPRYRYNEVQRNENLYQNLGNIGTAMHPIYYKTPDQIGTRWGITVYDPHKVGVQDVRYFNSQSPFTNLYLVQGGQGKTDLVVEFARNINPEWNVELFYNRKAANRVVGDNFSRNDVMLTHQVFGAATRFFTPK
ncbi:MAG: putative porin, partial [Bacteroidota bacterium]